MKQHTFDIGDWELVDFLSPIRNKRDVILLLMKTIKLVNSKTSVAPNRKSGEITLLISKMSRLFFVSDTKIFSIRFPFFVREDEDGLSISSVYVENIDSRVTSSVISIFSSEFDFPDILDFAEYIDTSANTDKQIWHLVRELFFFEDGYIRFDHDPENVNGEIHPLNHFDIFYTDQCSFKVGTREKLSVEDIIDVLDRETPCRYLT
jgi:hypothetical protein